MRIRSITAFTDVTYPLQTASLQAVGEALGAARRALVEAGYEVQTTRLATQPFPAALEQAGPAGAADLARDAQALAFVHEIDYVALGPVRLDDPAAHVESIADVLDTAENVFACVEIASRQRGGFSLPRIRRAAELIQRVSRLREDGFANLRLAALANVPPWAPFFPAAYHGGGKPCIAIATEAAELAVASITRASSLANAREALVQTIEAEAERIQSAVRRALGSLEVDFRGLDFSLAPYPEARRSIGAALEALGLPYVGAQGMLAASAFLTDAIDRAEFKRTGFCGLMLPVLEDTILAARAAEGRLHVTELLTASAVCGTGLDTIPLPGDVSVDALSAILADVAALSLRLDKPLTARLMPLPGKQAGDETEFAFEYFAPSRVMSALTEPLGGLLAGDETIALRSLSERE